jgi:hypothetical protein
MVVFFSARLGLRWQVFASSRCEKLASSGCDLQGSRPSQLTGSVYPALSMDAELADIDSKLRVGRAHGAVNDPMDVFLVTHMRLLWQNLAPA